MFDKNVRLLLNCFNLLIDTMEKDIFREFCEVYSQIPGQLRVVATKQIIQKAYRVMPFEWLSIIIQPHFTISIFLRYIAQKMSFHLKIPMYYNFITRKSFISVCYSTRFYGKIYPTNLVRYKREVA